jgi:hypothetical protein
MSAYILYIHFPQKIIIIFFIHFCQTCNNSHAFGVFYDVRIYWKIGTSCVIQMCYHLQWSWILYDGMSVYHTWCLLLLFWSLERKERVGLLDLLWYCPSQFASTLTLLHSAATCSALAHVWLLTLREFACHVSCLTSAPPGWKKPWVLTLHQDSHLSTDKLPCGQSVWRNVLHSCFYWVPCRVDLSDFSLPIGLVQCPYFDSVNLLLRPPLWSSGQSSWLQIRRPGFDSQHCQKKNSGSGTGSTQPREYNWGATW